MSTAQADLLGTCDLFVFTVSAHLQYFVPWPGVANAGCQKQQTTKQPNHAPASCARCNKGLAILESSRDYLYGSFPLPPSSHLVRFFVGTSGIKGVRLGVVHLSRVI